MIGSELTEIRKIRHKISEKYDHDFSKLLEQKNIEDLRTPPSNHLELLQGDRQGQYSIRINNRYRICFFWTQLGPTLHCPHTPTQSIPCQMGLWR